VSRQSRFQLFHKLRRASRASAKWPVSVLIAAIVLGPAAGKAIASSTSSGVFDYGPVLGYNYWNQDFLYNEGNSGSWGATEVGTQNNTNAPPGYMGADSLIYNSSGAYCLSGGWFYNPGYDSSISQLSGSGIQSSCGAGYYYTQGQTEAYNGDGYSAWYAYDTPDLYI